MLTAWLAACNPPKKNEGEACKTNFDCVEALVCIQEKCQKAEVKPEGKKPEGKITGALRVKVGENATLSATSSLFYSTSPKPKYTWGLVTKPDGSTASLSDTAASQVTIKPDVAGPYKISLKVADDTLQGDAVEVTLEAFQDNAPPPKPRSHPPKPPSKRAMLWRSMAPPAATPTKTPSPTLGASALSPTTANPPFKM